MAMPAQPHNEDIPEYQSGSKSFLKWVGGKSKLARQIIGLMPAHHCYCEVFGGAGWVLFKKSPSKVEVINDINGELVNLYRIIKHHPEEFTRQFDHLLIARDEYERFKAVTPSSLTDIQRAARYYYLVRMGYGGKISSHTFSLDSSRPPHINKLKLEEELAHANLRLTNVGIENQHYSRILERFDRPTTLFYLDPPYFGCEDYYGKGLFSQADFEKLRDQLISIQGKFILSLNNTPEIKRIFADFHIIETSVHWSLGKESNPANELLIMNFSPPATTS